MLDHSRQASLSIGKHAVSRSVAVRAARKSSDAAMTGASETPVRCSGNRLGRGGTVGGEAGERRGSGGLAVRQQILQARG